MTTAAQLRKTALANPGAAAEGTAYTVAGTVFAALDADKRVHLRLPASEAEDLAAQIPAAERTPQGVRVPVAGIGGQALNHWVRRAWTAAAPPDLAAQAARAEQARPGDVGDLPGAIGRPATQALANAGITRLDQVAALGDAELAALHGVGPKAIRILREAVARR
ncbi:helix-hairpin-helix domain-containing protein [Glycomyces albidus]|uniref:Helix-hairpin-helix domain-containing protein n=1 Tax=Glycomyces albidus TaxID=2656774 RepID=A0A6L5G3A7_9ACTN|nr:hypothetical protein [Glycomyces albidus]MQM24011.1 hypothetical protein [Glycomyces albidus]